MTWPGAIARAASAASSATSGCALHPAKAIGAGCRNARCRLDAMLHTDQIEDGELARRRDLNQNVEIAAVRCIASRPRAEQVKMRYAIGLQRRLDHRQARNDLIPFHFPSIVS